MTAVSCGDNADESDASSYDNERVVQNVPCRYVKKRKAICTGCHNYEAELPHLKKGRSQLHMRKRVYGCKEESAIKIIGPMSYGTPILHRSHIANLLFSTNEHLQRRAVTIALTVEELPRNRRNLHWTTKVHSS